MQEFEPVAAAGVLRDLPVASVALGFQHGAAVTEDGRVATWGKGERGQLGNSLNNSSNSEPSFCHLPTDVVVDRVSCGFNHTAALTSEGEVYVWGKMHSVAKNEKKSSGVSDVSVHEDQLLPRMLELPEERKVREQATFGVG